MSIVTHELLHSTGRSTVHTQYIVPQSTGPGTCPGGVPLSLLRSIYVYIPHYHLINSSNTTGLPIRYNEALNTYLPLMFSRARVSAGLAHAEKFSLGDSGSKMDRLGSELRRALPLNMRPAPNRIPPG